jgi:hypothetical protein
MNKNERLIESTLTGEVYSHPSYYYKYKDRYIIDTTHAADRMLQRNVDLPHIDKLTPTEMETLFKRIIDWTLSKNAETDRYYFFYSRSLRQGVIIKYEKEDPKYRPANPDIPQFVLITFLKRGTNQINNDQFKGKDRRIVVYLEKYNNPYVYYSEDFANYIGELLNDQGILLQESENKCPYIHKILMLSENESMSVILSENKLWDVHPYSVIEIE